MRLSLQTRFGLKTLLILYSIVVVFLAAFGWWLHNWRAEKHALSVLEAIGASVTHGTDSAITESRFLFDHHQGHWFPTVNVYGGVGLIEEYSPWPLIRAIDVEIEGAVIDGVAIQALNRLHKIRILRLRDCRICANVFDTERLPTSIRWLELHNCNLEESDLSFLIDLHNLEWLHLSGCNLSGVGLRQIAKLSALRVLCVSDNDAVRDSTLEVLSRLAELRVLGLNDTQVTDAGMIYLSRLRKLELLELLRTNVTDEGVQVFRDNKDLHITKHLGLRRWDD